MVLFCLLTNKGKKFCYLQDFIPFLITTHLLNLYFFAYHLKVSSLYSLYIQFLNKIKHLK